MATTNYTGHPAAAQILQQAIAHQMPQSYQHDLVIDINLLADMPTDEPFVWVLRENGTHLLRGPEGIYRFRMHFTYEIRRFYLWDGRRPVLTHLATIYPNDAHQTAITDIASKIATARAAWITARRQEEDSPMEAEREHPICTVCGLPITAGPVTETTHTYCESGGGDR
jgi:hypothetical protein